MGVDKTPGLDQLAVLIIISIDRIANPGEFLLIEVHKLLISFFQSYCVPGLFRAGGSGVSGGEGVFRTGERDYSRKGVCRAGIAGLAGGVGLIEKRVYRTGIAGLAGKNLLAGFSSSI